jgi:serine/threonine-protein kinase RsbW
LDAHLSLSLKSALASIETLSKEFSQFAARHSLPPRHLFAVNLALEEIVTNIISHACQGRDDQRIVVEVRVVAGELVASVEDSTAAFDPLQIPPPDLTSPLEERQPGGLGIHLARKLIDSLEYSRTDGKNRLVLRKRL